MTDIPIGKFKLSFDKDFGLHVEKIFFKETFMQRH